MAKISEVRVATDPREYIKFWFNSNKMTARETTKEPNLLGSISLDYNSFFSAVKFRNGDQKMVKCRKDDLEDAYNEYVNYQLRQEMKTALLSFKCVTEDLGPIRNWLLAVTGKTDPKDVAVMAHWLWLVKRNGFSLPVKHQIMPVLYGPQGGGKTVALEKLIKPIQDYRLTIGMNQLADERVYEGLANHFVVLFDELQGVERTDMNALKKQITTVYNSYRKLYSHSVINIPMRCSFIGATNRPINESFNDSTGMRRFWQINTLARLAWDVVGRIDYVQLYKGIDENKEDGYLTGESLQDIVQQQQTYINKESIEEFVVDNVLRYDETETVKFISQEELYNAYVMWAGRVGLHKRLDLHWFARKLETRIKYRTVKNLKGHAKKLYMISSKSDVEPGVGTEKLLKESNNGQH